MSNHTVNKISIVLPASDYNQAREYQASAKHWANHSLPEMLNDYFDKINKNDEIVYQDKIEISLADFPWRISDAEWKEKIQNSIRANISPTELFPIIFRQWLFYLRNGCFENTAILKTLRDSENYVFSNWKNVSQQLMNEIRSNAISSALLNRLLFQHSREFIITVIEKLFSISHDFAIKITTVLQTELKRNADTVQQIVARIIELISQRRITEKHELIAQLAAVNNSKPIEELVAKASSKTDIAKPNKNDRIEDVYINCSNAGLVLLFPYLKMFFENNLLIEKTEFVNEAARLTAIQALHFLATGNNKAEEEELIIPKLLCGVEPDEYVGFENELSDPIKTEAEELLQAVIEHWKILQNTSVNGLRVTFLQRDGKLIKHGDQYTLQVAESGVDILLNNIPWGFRNYKLPWMPFTVITEWY